jgi:hypothetical protein
MPMILSASAQTVLFMAERPGQKERLIGGQSSLNQRDDGLAHRAVPWGS